MRSSAVQNQPGKPWLPITWVGIGGRAAVTRSCLSEGQALGNAGARRRAPRADRRARPMRREFRNLLEKCGPQRTVRYDFRESAEVLEVTSHASAFRSKTRQNGAPGCATV